MREIKFRVWDNDEKKLKFLGGNYLALAINSWGLWKNDNTLLTGSDEGSGGVLMQYTGLKDKNGVEIYEGDLFKDEEDIIEVFWCKRHAGFEFKNILNSHGFIYESTYDVEVIGNIYENPELLKGHNG